MVCFATQVAVTYHVRETASVYAALRLRCRSAPSRSLTRTGSRHWKKRSCSWRPTFMPPSTGSSPWWPSTTVCVAGKWEATGRAPTGWPSGTGYSLGAARERVRAARALADLPETSAAMSRGELSFCAVRALTRVATPENETDLLDLARGATTAQLERMVRGFKLGSRQDEADREKERFESRSFSVFPDEEGMYEVKGRLTPEVGALLMRAVEAASDALYREKGPKSVSYETSFEDAAHRRADALGLVAERAMAAGFSSPG